jgi:hypothetical protein
MGVRQASEAVSGCNILILPIYASVLRPSGAGAPMADSTGHCGATPSVLVALAFRRHGGDTKRKQNRSAS